MTSVSALFYARRTRLGRTASDSDDLGFLSSHRFHDTNPSRRHRANSRTIVRSELRHRSDQYNPQNRHVTSGELDDSGRPCSQSTAQDTAPPESVIEAPIQNSFHGDALDSIRLRFNDKERLPRSVLLAKERLVQRLRGVSVSSVREIHDIHPGTHFDSYWFNVEENTFLTVLTSPGSRQLQESNSDPSLHHEVFNKAADNDSNQKFSGSDECSICLESYAEGSKLISLQCGHRFHSSCLSPWLQTCSKCPYCRSEVSNH